MSRMIDQNGFEISRPRTINLKMSQSLFDFSRKKRLLWKWIVTAEFGDKRLAVTGRVLNAAREPSLGRLGVPLPRSLRWSGEPDPPASPPSLGAADMLLGQQDPGTEDELAEALGEQQGQKRRGGPPRRTEDTRPAALVHFSSLPYMQGQNVSRTKAPR